MNTDILFFLGKVSGLCGTHFIKDGREYTLQNKDLCSQARNIAVISKGGRFQYCPALDQGAGPVSNVMYAPMDIIPKFTRSKLYELLRPLLPYYASHDQALIADRVCETVLFRQKQQYIQ